MKKERLDKLVVQSGLTETREQAKRLIMAGQIYDENNQRYDKPGEKIDMTDQILLDIGASTGGFTDAALQNGAKLSYALDVGYNQLAYKLRQDDRVVVMERQNFRHSKPEDFTEGTPTIASIDVSFISLALILPPLVDILQSGGSVLVLIKPQFEAGPDRVGKKGIIKDSQVHKEVVNEVIDFICRIGFEILDLTYSPITGGEGNIEFLAHLRNAKNPNNHSYEQINVDEVVQSAHDNF